MRSLLLVSLLSMLSLPVIACGSSGTTPESFPTLQDCFDDHTSATGEALPVTEAITVCCIDHPINGVKPSCGTTQTECETIVRAGLDQTVVSGDITTACMDYVTQLGQ